MRQAFTLFFIMASALAFGQTEQYLIDYRITKIVYQGDSIVFDKTKSVEINLSKTSDIIEIAHINDTYLGVRFEILKSDLAKNGSYIAGKVYYVKTATTDWEEISQFGHDNITLEKISEKQKNDTEFEEQLKNARNKKSRERLLSGNSETVGNDPVLFGIYYQIHFYIK